MAQNTISQNHEKITMRREQIIVYFVHSEKSCDEINIFMTHETQPNMLDAKTTSSCNMIFHNDRRPLGTPSEKNTNDNIFIFDPQKNDHIFIDVGPPQARLNSSLALIRRSCSGDQWPTGKRTPMEHSLNRCLHFFAHFYCFFRF